MKLLIIEDEPSLNASIVNYLQSHRYLCESVGNYGDALEKIECFSYDCIVLDVMMPGGTGLQLLQHLKDNNKNDGVIIVSAKDELDDKINGLQMGADDYLTKPFHLSELGVRVAAIIRRKNFQGNSTLELGEIKIDVQAKTVAVSGKLIALTRKEYDLLLYFMINKNRVLSKQAITTHLWGDEMEVSGNADFIYTHIKNLRKKMEQAGAGDYIQSVYGMGYKFSAF